MSQIYKNPKTKHLDILNRLAICEMCGMAVCSKHVINDHSKFFCSDHKTLQISSNKKIPHINQMKWWTNSEAMFTHYFQLKNFFRKKNDEIQEVNDHAVKIEETTKAKDAIEQTRKDNETNTLGCPIKWWIISEPLRILFLLLHN